MTLTSQRYCTTLVMLLMTLVIAMMSVISSARAAPGTADDLSRSIENKQAEIEGIRSRIEQYETKIRAYEQTQQYLVGEIAILENRSKKTLLDIEQNELQISKTELELRRLATERHDAQQALAQQKEIVVAVLQELYMYGDQSALSIVFGNERFSQYFDQLQYLSILQEDLQTSIARIEALHERLILAQQQEDAHKERLLETRDGLAQARRLLDDEQRAKDILLATTERSEAQFRTLLSELRAEQQYIASELFRLQEQLNRQLEENDAVPLGPTVLSWPVNNSVITSTFHDPTYPFRNLFEHSGLDMAVPQGTPVRAAAPGYVAWTRTGRSYGNYVLIVHTNGVATLYAHLSGFNVLPDQFVERGQVIASSGGMPGTPGAGLSTGPHVHFEAREQGIPVDPYKYLVSR